MAWAAIKFHWTNNYSWLITVLTNFDLSLSLLTEGFPMKSGFSGWNHAAIKAACMCRRRYMHTHEACPGQVCVGCALCIMLTQHCLDLHITHKPVDICFAESDDFPAYRKYREQQADWLKIMPLLDKWSAAGWKFTAGILSTSGYQRFGSKPLLSSLIQSGCHWIRTMTHQHN